MTPMEACSWHLIGNAAMPHCKHPGRIAMSGLFGACLLMATPVEALADHRCASWHDTNVMVAVDYSTSMAGWKAELARDFAVAVIDELSLVGHLERAGGVAFPDLSPLFPLPLSTANRTTLRVALLGTASNGNTTPLYDAIVDASIYIQQVSVPGSKILLVVTDGEDNDSDFTALDATTALASAAAWKLMVFAGVQGDTGYTALQQIAGNSGSEFVSAASSAAITTLVDRVLAEACANFHPHAQIVLSDDELHLGVEGTSIAFDGSASSDHESPAAQLSYMWTFTRPDGSQSTQSGAQVSLSFTDQMLALGEGWNAQLQVSDPSGGSDTAQRGFRLVGSAPNIQVTGDTSVTVGQPIMLQADGEDPDGGAVSFSWDIVASPSRSTHTPQAGFRTRAQLNVPTESVDIGEWQFRVTATDTEGDSSAPELVDVEVVNLPPRIELTGPPQVSVGQTIRIETAVIEDDDGGDLTFRWDIVQAPQGAGAAVVQEGFAEGSGAEGAVLTYNTADQDAGSWIFRLVATDDDQVADSETEAEFVVLVDAPPNATIDGPTLIGSSAFPLVLDGAGSLDPDSPCPQQPDRCHDTLDGRPVSVPDDPLRFTWAMVEIPGELTNSYTVGTADDALGLYAHDPELSIDYGLLEPGDWTFELTATDGEGNSDTAARTVSIADENGHPTAVVSGPRRYIVSSGNILSRDIVLTGIGSYDRDNILNGELLGDGVGITRYDWEVLESPPGCAPPTLPGGPDEGTITPWHAGDSVPPACQGIWRILLTVTDDDTSPVTDFAETLVGIGNCPDPLCIDYPTAARPQFIEFVRGTRVEIGYHLDSTIYTAPQFGAGLVAQLAIYHESDLITPVHVARDANVLATDRGAQLRFRWDGRDGSRTRPRPGRYTVEVTLLDARLGTTTFTAREPNAVWIQYVEYRILPNSDSLIARGALVAGIDQATIRYQPYGTLTADTLRWQVLDDGGSVVFEATAPPTSGVIEWDGRTTTDFTVVPGNYSVQLEPFRHGVSLGASEGHPLTVFQVAMTWAGDLSAWGQVFGPGDEAQLHITTTPRQVTNAELIELGFPLTLHSQFAVPTGVTMTTQAVAAGQVTGIFIVPAGTTALPSDATISDAPSGVLLSFRLPVSPAPILEPDITDEFASSDDAISSPAQSRHDDSNAFDANMLAKGWRQVGRGRDNGELALIRPAASRSFVIHAGSEQVWFSLWGEESEKRQVRQQSDWFYYSGHGSHLTGELLTPAGAVAATDVQWRGDLDVVIIAGCSVLDIRDYRARNFDQGTHDGWMLIGGGASASPGEKWENTGPKYLLGYAWAAPYDIQGSEDIITDFIDAVDAGNSVIEAWRIANDPATHPFSWNAAAIDASENPHKFCYWDEATGSAIWTCIAKESTGWPDLPY